MSIIKSRNFIRDVFLLILLTPAFSFAVGGTDGFVNLNKLILSFANGVVRSTGYMMFTIAVVVFFWGIVQFIWAARQGAEGKGIQKGTQFMKWGLIAIFVMFSVWGIIKFAQDVFQIQGENTIIVPSLDFIQSGGNGLNDTTGGNIGCSPPAVLSGGRCINPSTGAPVTGVSTGTLARQQSSVNRASTQQQAVAIQETAQAATARLAESKGKTVNDLSSCEAAGLFSTATCIDAWKPVSVNSYTTCVDSGVDKNKCQSAWVSDPTNISNCDGIKNETARQNCLDGTQNPTAEQGAASTAQINCELEGRQYDTASGLCTSISTTDWGAINGQPVDTSGAMNDYQSCFDAGGDSATCRGMYPDNTATADQAAIDQAANDQQNQAWMDAIPVDVNSYGSVTPVEATSGVDTAGSNINVDSSGDLSYPVCDVCG